MTKGTDTGIVRASRFPRGTRAVMAAIPLLHVLLTRYHAAEVFPERFLYPDGGMSTHDLRKELGHALWGGLNALTGHIDAHTARPLISVTGSISITLALFCAGSVMFGSEVIGIPYELIFLFAYDNGLRGNQLITIACSFPFGKIFLLVFIAAATRYLTSGGRMYLVTAALASLTAAGTHINHFLIIAFVSAVFSIVMLGYTRGGQWRSRLTHVILPLAAVLILVNLPYLTLRFVRDYAPDNDIHLPAQGIFSISDRLAILNPLVFFKVAGPLFALSVISAFILWKQARRNETLRLLSRGAFTVIAVAFNPALVPLLMRRISYLLIRFEIAIPSIPLPAYLLRTLWLNIRSIPDSLSNRAAVFGWIAVAALLFTPIAATPGEFAYSGNAIREERKNGCLYLADLFQAINGDVPRESTIASNPVTSYFIPAFTDQYVIRTHDQHTVPNDSTALEGILATRDILTPGAEPRRIISLLETCRAGYLLVNGRIPPSITSMYWKPDPGHAEAAIEKIARLPELFHPLYRHEAASLFAFDAEAARDFPLSGTNQDSLACATELLPEAEMRHTVGSGQPHISIKRVSPDRTTVNRGDTPTVTIEWGAERSIPPGRYSAFIRFDTGYPRGPLYRNCYGKIYREIYQLVSGGRFRFTVKRLPLNGIYPPDRWPPLRVVRDSFIARVPRNMSPGVYTVRVKLLQRTHFPNHTLRDFMSDDDSLAGTAMAEVTIE